MHRRTYLQGLAGATGFVTVSATGQARKHSGDGRGPPDDVPPGETPPRRGDSVIGLAVDPIAPVRIGIIGLGNRGASLTQHLDRLDPDMAEIRAICDVVDDRVESMAASLQADPDTYSAGVGEDEWDGRDEWRAEVPVDDPEDMIDDTWMEVAERDDLDLIFVFSDLDSHATMCTYAMEQGKHVATEVAAAETIEQCWDLVDTAERTQKNCMMLEQVNYFEEELWVLNMIREGVFGDELSYAYGSYINPQVGSYMHDYGPPVNWRARRHLHLKGDLYPTHGLGPLAWYMDLLRGDRPEYLIAQESPETRFSQYAQNELEPDHEFYGETDWANGDTTKSLIKTNRDRSIEIQFDVKTNRPYGLGNEVVGVDAYFNGYQAGQRSHLAIDDEGAPALVDDDTFEAYQDEYRHPLWSEEYEDVNEHGADFIMLYRIIDALNTGRPLDQDVYDAATWSAVGPLSRISIEHGGMPVVFPDFTRGQWSENRQLEVMDLEE
ncbi:Gfo/Idh/MocA family protein [Natrononativus amylolyticus]|uniref:Gfo/Idh/MocA family protein n=1 Tax=Natrononativus amylolyticus TaxID=2963434 RepID=UPI0020CF4ADD|nr:Gfo/Idh/MocA family oxidoreductase [Natrononativus amylolyticus]